MSELQRQPRTFWQWLTNQPGSLFVPPTVLVAPARNAIDAIETAIARMHVEMEDLRSDEYVSNNQAYHMLVEKLGNLHNELIRRSKEENK